MGEESINKLFKPTQNLWQSVDRRQHRILPRASMLAFFVFELCFKFKQNRTIL